VGFSYPFHISYATLYTVFTVFLLPHYQCSLLIELNLDYACHILSDMKQYILVRPRLSNSQASLKLLTSSNRCLSIRHAGIDKISVETFRSMTNHLTAPLLLQNTDPLGCRNVPALSTWFDYEDDQVQLSRHLKSHAAALFPYEMMSPQNQTGSTSVDVVRSFHQWLTTRGDIGKAFADLLTPMLGIDSQKPAFHRFYAPLQLLSLAQSYNISHKTSTLQLYIAQSSIHDLPAKLQQDLPIPSIVSRSGKGDVYNSSIWLGLEPTYSPLHRDPNPNLFYQLCGSKHFRLLPPTAGDRLFRQIQSILGGRCSSRIRDSTMMDGPGSDLIHSKVWGPDDPTEEVVGACLSPGDSIFIPKGWWHSVKSSDSDGRLNGSVNWWFR
jgi:hypothetical protein